MTTYKGIQGFTIQNLSADPTDPNEGQLWYNSTSNVWKVQELTVDTFATGGNLPAPVRQNIGAGTQTAALSSIGYSDATAGYLTATNEYDGTSWTAGGSNTDTARNAKGSGIQTAALSIGGVAASKPPSATEEYDGSTWSGGGSLGTGGYDIGATGPQTACLAFGGYVPGSPDFALNVTQHYDGSTWSTPPATLATARRGPGNAAGTQTAGLCIGGGPPDATLFTAATEEYDGTSWTAGGSLSEGKRGGYSSGTQTAALTFSGTISGPARTNATEKYDGTSWSTSPATFPSTIVAGGDLGGSGTQSASLAIGGSGPPSSNLTIEFNGGGSYQSKTITVS
jgi:hypothetical protein